jgi:DNA replication protein DnaC
MINENDYFKAVYEKYKADREAQGIPISDLTTFHESIQEELAQGLSLNRKPKEKAPLTPEQQAMVAAYYNKVRYMDKQTVTHERYKFDTNLMELKDAKKIVWVIMQDMLKERGMSFDFDNYNKQVLDNLVRYYIRDTTFDGVLDKGICLFGDVGRGKTFLMEVFSEFAMTYDLPTAFLLIDMKSISREAQEQGAKVVTQYTQGVRSYDDVGFEEKAKNFGNNICVFTELINISYNKFVKSGKLCHITTNLAMDASFGLGTFNEHYGARVTDRCKEMFNFIYLGGDSKR